MRNLVILILSISLIACSTPIHQPPSHQKTSHQLPHARPAVSKQDGAPRHPKPFNYGHVRPKFEPMSRYGNPASYRVEGQRYDVMTSAKNYKKRGIASWYGTKFHKKRTSSGEDYNMYAMTAAHRTLPIPSYIRVKNLNNGRVAIVRVNDRGPFHSSRIVDLSYAAANYLGLLPKGTAPVEIQAIAPKGKHPTQVARYYIQAAAFHSPSLAKQLRTKLLHQTPAPIHIEHYQSRYIVRLGPFKNKQASQAFQNNLRRQGLKGVFSYLQ